MLGQPGHQLVPGAVGVVLLLLRCRHKEFGVLLHSAIAAADQPAAALFWCDGSGQLGSEAQAPGLWRQDVELPRWRDRSWLLVQQPGQITIAWNW